MSVIMRIAMSLTAGMGCMEAGIRSLPVDASLDAADFSSSYVAAGNHIISHPRCSLLT